MNDFYYFWCKEYDFSVSFNSLFWNYLIIFIFIYVDGDFVVYREFILIYV